MPTLTLLTHVLTLALLPQISLGQDSPQCSALSPSLAYNTSSTTTLPALAITWQGATADNNIRIVNVTDQQWQLSALVQPAYTSHTLNRTQTVLWLDTGRSNLTRLGTTMRMCHNFVPLQVAANVTWSYETLKKSVGDTGDCRALVSEACLDKLRAQYSGQAGAQRGRKWNRCQKTNNTVPWECEGSGMVETISAPNPEFNSTLDSRFAYLQSPVRDVLNTTADDSLVCAGRNLSSSTALLGPTQDYDLGVNFPIMDIMTFFGTADYGRVQSTQAHRVQIACLVPGQVTEGSREKASVDSVLARYNSTGGNQTAGAQALGRGMATWMMVAWTFVVGVAFVV
ncbi:hypothetical protein E8E13_006421 [Curvularia kusanoi]|uniref:Uncharacterized protein n=1 Tax=Curvularia kusanoi TaxID=90978 RepID=A0A9P4TAP2_CURKU|nr:hypothetical protein E8E13_006421 [Curvularia kusanoi]